MRRTCSSLLALVICGLAFGADGEADKGKPKVKTLSEMTIGEKLGGKRAKATTVEITFEPGQAGAPHRHPGPVFGYVIEGEYEWAIDDQATRTLKPGDTFYEPTGCLHRVSKNPGNTRVRVLAVRLHPDDIKQLATGARNRAWRARPEPLYRAGDARRRPERPPHSRFDIVDWVPIDP
jgi:quercetin dioxygenase-like cupin family protein